MTDGGSGRGADPLRVTGPSAGPDPPTGVVPPRAATEAETFDDAEFPDPGDGEQIDIYLALVEHAPDAIVILDVGTGRFVSANRAAERLFGRGRAELLEMGLLDVSPPVQPDGRRSEDVAASCIAEALGGGRPRFEWLHRRADGREVPCEVTLLRLPATGRDLVRGSVLDITERREAQRARETAAAEQAARRAAEAGAARLQAMVSGLNAIVWERDPETLRFRFVNERIEELLGYPVADWLGDADLWQRIIHPDDRDAAVEGVRRGIAEATDFSLSYRVRTASGRLVWLHQLAHVVSDDDGVPAAVHAVLFDVTEQKRREQAAELLAAAGQLLAAPGGVEERLGAVAGLAVGVLCDLASVWLRENDGRYRPVAAAPAESAEQVLALAPVSTPPELEAAYLAGRPFVVPEPAAPQTRSVLVAPLVSGGRVVGGLSLVTSASERSFDDADLALAGELGQRIATMVASEQVAARERQLHAITAALSAAGTAAEAAAELSDGMRQALGASGVVACSLDEDSLLHLVHALGYAPEKLDHFRTMPLSAPLPITDAARTGLPVWLPDRDAWRQRYPAAVDALLEQTQAGIALPLRVGERVVGAVGASFPTRRDFAPEERAFLLTLAGQAAVAFERAVLADVRRDMADTLQRSLLPRSLPTVEGLSVTARYLPGVHGTQAGGDWYDVLPLDGRGVAVVVGDVVGNGAPAAAVMGQLRSALAAVLLEGHAPARALELLDRFAGQIVDAEISTVACLLLDPATGTLTYSRAGHPPPLVLDGAGAHLLDGGWGPALGLPVPAARTETTVTLRSDATLVVFTDGLVERRGESLDDGLDHLVAVGATLLGSRPAALVDGLLEALVGESGPADDVAVVAARLLSAPLALDLAGEPHVLAVVRRAVAGWAAAAMADPATTDDLQLAIGEAVANAVEHAYRDADVVGRVRLDVVAGPGEDITVTVADGGRWRPTPADPGFRGRGLQIIDRLAVEVDLLRDPEGTTLSFRMPWRAEMPVGPRAPGEQPVDVRRSAAVDVTDREGRRRLAVSGDLDLEGVTTVRSALLEAVGEGPVTLDLTGVGHLASVGMGVLLEVASRAEDGPGSLEVVLPADGPARRALDLTGLGRVLTERGH